MIPPLLQVLHSVMQGLSDQQVEFPFRVSPAEQDIISHVPDPPCSMIL